MVTKPSKDAGSVLFGSTRRAVLGLLMGRPDQRFHLRQVARLANVGLGPVQRELAALSEAGILHREQSGRQVYFQANRQHPIFSELAALIQKTAGAAAILRDALAPLESRISLAVLFGSVARGEAGRTSDVDLLVISEHIRFRDAAAAIRHASSRLGRDVNLNLYKPSEWAERARAGHPLVRSILEQPRIAVIGDASELERLAEERVGKAPSSRRPGNQKVVRRNRARPARQR